MDGGQRRGKFGKVSHSGREIGKLSTYVGKIICYTVDPRTFVRRAHFLISACVLDVCILSAYAVRRLEVI